MRRINKKNKKTMKRILYVFTLMLLTAGVMSAPTQKKGAIITVVDNAIVHDFGKIKEADGAVSHTFKIKNEGDEPLVITRSGASCGCTTPSSIKEPIAPGKTGELTVKFDPTGRPGPFTKTISVYSNGKTGSFILTIKGDVTAK